MCGYPLIQYNSNLKRYIQIPCGRCLNCQIDKRRQWEERAEYEYKQKLTGSFITLTYADENLIKCRKIDNENNNQFSLCKEHLQKYIEEVRAKVKEIWKPENNVLCNKEFSYIACGEYGESNKELPRPHYHILMFGLDYIYCKKILEEAWKGGIVDIRPILKGGIRYILKYMDKQLNEIENFNKYDRIFKERPFKTQSKGFGSGLYKEKIDSGEATEKNNFEYKGKNGKICRIPTYYLNKYFGITYQRPGPDLENQIKLYNQTHNSNQLQKGNCIYYPKARKGSGRETLRDWNIKRAQAREANLTEKIRAEGKAVNDEWKLNYKEPWKWQKKYKNEIKNLTEEATDEYYNDIDIF